MTITQRSGAADPRQVRRPLHTGPTRIAIVEDDPLSRTLLSHMVSLLGHVPIEPASPSAAIDAAASGEIDLMLLDLNLDQDDGFAILERIRALELRPDAIRLPVIAVTGYVAEQDRTRCLDAGFDRHLGKPVRIEALRDAIEACGLPPRDAEQDRSGMNDAARVVETARRLRETQPGDFSLGPTVLEKFAMRSVRWIEHLQEAARGNDRQQLFDAVEAVRAGADFMGALRLAQLTTDLLSACAQSDTATMQQLLRSISAEHEAILALLLAPPVQSR